MANEMDTATRELLVKWGLSDEILCKFEGNGRKILIIRVYINSSVECMRYQRLYSVSRRNARLRLPVARTYVVHEPACRVRRVRACQNMSSNMTEQSEAVV